MDIGDEEALERVTWRNRANGEECWVLGCDFMGKYKENPLEIAKNAGFSWENIGTIRSK